MTGPLLVCALYFYFVSRLSLGLLLLLLFFFLIRAEYMLRKLINPKVSGLFFKSSAFFGCVLICCLALKGYFFTL